jgi:hypothetical protein
LLQMRKLIVVIILIMSSIYAMAQHTADLGVQLAAATYWGDIENVNRSKSITPVVGILGRWNFNKRLAVRGQLFTGNLKAEGFFEDANIWHSGDPNRVNPEVYPREPDSKYNFNRTFQSVEALFEFNFRDYKLGRTKKDNYTPFVSVGLGGFFTRASRVGSFILEQDPDVAGSTYYPGSIVYPAHYVDPATYKLTNNSDVLTLTIPVGAGLKFNITKRLGGVIEVIVRKTFADNIDNLDDPQRFKLPLNANGANFPSYPDKVSGLNNNDWYATLAVSVCYQLWSSKGNCAIYDKIKK